MNTCVIAKLRILVTQVIFMALFGCTAVSGAPTEPASTSEITIVPSPTVGITPSPQVLPSPTKESFVSPPSTSTALPTLQPAQAQALVLELLEGNAGCRLPCWWGFLPDTTAWTSAQSILDTIATNIFIAGSSEEPPIVAYYRFPTPDEVSSLGLPTTFVIEGDRITSIEISDFDSSTYYVPSLLSSYGPPGEIWVSTYRSPYNSSLPFVVVLYYPKEGILASYSAEGNLQGAIVEGCLQTGPSLRLWSPSERLSFIDAARLFDWDVEGVPYQPLAEVTNMDIEAFYLAFHDAKATVCLETSAELWPEP